MEVGAPPRQRSFRDPAGSVVEREGVLYRFVNPGFTAGIDLLERSGLYARLVGQRSLVSHERIDPKALGVDGVAVLLRPERIPFISYPYEWTFGQLRDAALLTLDIQSQALRAGLTLRDSSAYNVQFIGSRPVFIDTLSFGEHPEGSPWNGYKQFVEHFLVPLAAMSYCHENLRLLHLAFFDGIPLDLGSSLLPLRTWLRPGLALHVHAHARAQRRYRHPAATSRDVRIPTPRLLSLVDHLAMTVRSLKPPPVLTEWSEYETEQGYSDLARGEKKGFLRDLAEQHSPRRILDLGANRAEYSRVCSVAGSYTIALDADHGAVSRVYADEKRRAGESILPLIVDLTQPSPASGWSNLERMAFAERGQADFVLALALMHHVVVGRGISMAAFADFLASVATEHLVVEYIPFDDPQVSALTRSRSDAIRGYSEMDFQASFATRFEVTSTRPLSGTARKLYHFHRR